MPIDPSPNPLVSLNGAPKAIGVDTIFNLTGFCGNCGAPIGKLKPPAGYNPGYNVDKISDPLTYHISPWLTKATIKCPT